MRPFVTARRGNAAGEIEAGHGRDGAGFLDELLRIFFDGGKHAAHHAAAAEVADERAGVEIGNNGDAGFGKKVAGLFVGTPVAGDCGELADHEAFDVGLGGFVIRSDWCRSCRFAGW